MDIINATTLLDFTAQFTKMYICAAGPVNGRTPRYFQQTYTPLDKIPEGMWFIYFSDLYEKLGDYKKYKTG